MYPERLVNGRNRVLGTRERDTKGTSIVVILQYYRGSRHPKTSSWFIHTSMNNLPGRLPLRIPSQDISVFFCGFEYPSGLANLHDQTKALSPIDLRMLVEEVSPQRGEVVRDSESFDHASRATLKWSRLVPRGGYGTIIDYHSSNTLPHGQFGKSYQRATVDLPLRLRTSNYLYGEERIDTREKGREIGKLLLH